MIETRFTLDEIKTACKDLLVEEKASLVQHLLSSDLVLPAVISTIDSATPQELSLILQAVADRIVRSP